GFRERRHAWHLVTGHRDYDVVGLEAAGAGLDDVLAAAARQTIDAHAVADRQLKTARVGFEIIRHLVVRGKRERRRRKLHPHEPIERSGREQTERIPAIAPGVTDAPARVEDDERPSDASEVVTDRQPRLAAADHDRVESLD